MSVHLKLRKCLSEANRMTKVFDTGTGIDIELEGNFVEASQDILHPSFKVQSSVNLSSYNYAEITEFGRKYFMHPTALYTDFWQLDCDVDLLSTYASGLGECEAIVKRTETPGKINYYINDGVFFTEQRERITYTEFKKDGAAATLGTPAYYLMVAGG